MKTRRKSISFLVEKFKIDFSQIWSSKGIKIWFFGLFALLLVGLGNSSFALQVPGATDATKYQILNQQEDNILDTMKDQKDTWRKGAQDAIKSSDGNDNYKIDNLINSDTEITSQWEAITMVTNAGDDKAQEEGKKTLLKIARAIAGIAVSWLIISFIFWLIEQIVGK